jgi:hypothetical protein
MAEQGWTGWSTVPQAPVARRTLMFANDKSSGKTTVASAVIVSLLAQYPGLMQRVVVREYERHPRLSTLFRPEDGILAVEHHDARNAEAFDRLREMQQDPNATLWDDLLYRIGQGALMVDFGANMFAEICRILDDEPRPIFPDGGEAIGVAVPVTTASDSVESAISAAEAVLGWGPRCQLFLIEQEYLGRFGDAVPVWSAWKRDLLAREPQRVQAVTIERLLVADIGGVVFQRIDRMVAEANAALRTTQQGAAYIRAVRLARAEIAWGARTLEAVRPITDWFAG